MINSLYHKKNGHRFDFLFFLIGFISRSELADLDLFDFVLVFFPLTLFFRSFSSVYFLTNLLSVAFAIVFCTVRTVFRLAIFPIISSSVDVSWYDPFYW